MELMVAVGILLIVISALLAAFVSCILLNESNNNLSVATNDAQYVLEEIKVQAYDQVQSFINSYNTAKFSNLNNETISFPGCTYGADITQVTVNVNWTERGRNRNFSLSTEFAR